MAKKCTKSMMRVVLLVNPVALLTFILPSLLLQLKV